MVLPAVSGSDGPARHSLHRGIPSAAKPARKHPLTDPRSLRRVLRESLLNLNPYRLANNPAMLVTEIGAATVTIFSLRDLILISRDVRFDLQVAFWLWLTVLAGNFTKALATARALAHADALRRSRSDLTAKRLVGKSKIEIVPASKLRKGDRILCEAGDLIPADGEITEGIAIVDESAITGESAPVIRESGGDRSTVSAGTRVVSDEVEIRITANRGETFLERRIGLVEDLESRSWPSEVEVQRVLGVITVVITILMILFAPALLRLLPELGRSAPDAALLVIPLLVCLLPTPIAGLLSAMNISAMDHTLREGVLPASGKALESAATVQTVLLDKTGTVTVGNRTAVALIPCAGITQLELARTAYSCSVSDDTPEGRSIVQFASTFLPPAGRVAPEQGPVTNIPFSGYTRMSGVDFGVDTLRKGATSSIAAFVRSRGGVIPPEFNATAEQIASEGGTPLGVAQNDRLLGLIYLKDVLRPGYPKQIAPLRSLGIRTMLITGDNPVTAAAIAREIGVDEAIAQKTAADKLAYIKAEQEKGRFIAMVGDGANDAPALAQADIGMTLAESGSPAAKEASNMVDLHDEPGKLYEVICIARRLAATRASVATFSGVSSLAKYLIIIPAIFAGAFPALGRWNLLRLHSPKSALLSAAAVNALLLLALMPTAFLGVRSRAGCVRHSYFRTLGIYALAGVVAPALAIWVLDRLIVAIPLI